MIPFKNHNASQPGQTFIEIMLTIFIIGSLLSAVLVMQSTIFSRVVISVSRMHRIFMARQALFEADLDALLQKKPVEKRTIEKPPTTITYKEKKVDEKSALYGFKNTVVAALDVSWNLPYGAEQETLVAVRHRLPRKKK